LKAKWSNSIFSEINISKHPPPQEVQDRANSREEAHGIKNGHHASRDDELGLHFALPSGFFIYDEAQGNQKDQQENKSKIHYQTLLAYIVKP
jgi:hypothetical protein